MKDEAQRKLLSNFEASLFLYTELLYWANHPIGHSFHGPYVNKEGSKFIQSLDEQHLVERHAEYWFYALKPMCDLVNEDWRPPQAVRDNIYKKYDEIKSVWENVVKKNFEKTAVLPIGEQEKLLKEHFDPRN